MTDGSATDRRLALTAGVPDVARDLDIVRALARRVGEAGGRALVVGGFVRDTVLEEAGTSARTKDIDVEVYGVPFEALLPLVAEIGPINVVGAAFQVIKLEHTGIDISIPRRDSKTGPGHRGFVVQGDPTMSVREAARRRDFTINALAADPLTDELIDEHGGLEDLRARILRATDSELFGDDPLRVLRAMQFVARFELTIDPGTVEICRSLDLRELAAERIGEEWTKLLLRARRPSIGLAAADQLGVLDRIHPELAVLRGTPQEPTLHPEGDVWRHTMLVVDAAAHLIRRRDDLSATDRLTVMLGALCHDLGKPATTETRADGRITSLGHSEAGLAPAEALLTALRTPLDIVARVLKLVQFHLWPGLTLEFTDRAVRRLARHLTPATVDLLVLVATADRNGRGEPYADHPRGAELLARAAELSVSDGAVTPIVLGRHLVSQGMAPGPAVGRILATLYEAQESGEFHDLDGGLAYLRDRGLLTPPTP